jgi:hypothetical protein
VTAALVAAAPALAAPARTGEVNRAKASYTWSFDNGTGLFGDAMVADKAPCTPVAQTCDFTLVHVTGEEPGDLTFSTATSDQTLVDVDVYLYSSDKDGTQGSELTKGVAFSPAESVGTSVEPGGWYLLKVAYMTGFGAYDGTATFTPYEPELPEE